MHVREAGDGPVGEREAASLPELVEAVLRAEAERDPRERARHLPVDVGVHEVRVQERRPVADEVARQAQEGDRVDVGPERNRVERHAAPLELARELPGAGLVLVEHEHPDVPAAVAQAREEREQVRLRAGDPGHLLHVEDQVAHP